MKIAKANKIALAKLCLMSVIGGPLLFFVDLFLAWLFPIFSTETISILTMLLGLAGGAFLTGRFILTDAYFDSLRDSRDGADD